MLSLVKRLKTKLFLSPLQLMARRWNNDGGDERFRFNYTLNEQSIVMDLGGYDGQWASDLYSRYNCRIYIFEPVKAYAEAISLRFAANPRIDVIPYALGSDDKSIMLSVCGTSSSVYSKNGPMQEIIIRDATTWIKNNGILRIDLMKINIEGGEYDLMNRLIDSGMVDRIENIQIQFHEIDSHSRASMQNIQQHLSKTHHLTYSYEFIWENWARSVSTNAVA